MTDFRPGWDAEAEGWILPTIDLAKSCGPGPCIVCPILQGLGADLADIAAALPIGDANGLLLDAVESHVALAPHVIAGVLANDPFRRQEQLLRRLSRHSLGAVANWPTLGLISGELAAALTYSGFTFDAEMAMLRQARAMGLATVAFTSAAEQVEKALSAGPDMVVVAPALSDATEQGRKVAAQEAMALFHGLRRRTGHIQVRLYEAGRMTETLAASRHEGQRIRFVTGSA